MKSIVVALGNRRYQVERPWPKSDHSFQAICDVAVLADGRVAALRRRTPEVQLFSAAGELVDEWTVSGLVSPHYIWPTNDGGALIADWDGHQILALNAQGNVDWTLGDPANPGWMEPFNHPTSACLDAAGNLYVTDGYGNACVHSFDKERKLRYTMGSSGKALGEFSTPHCVVPVRNGRLLVSDRENSRLQLITPEGQAVAEITDVYKPMALATLPDGNILVTDQTPRLSLFSPHGSLLGRCRTFSTVAHGMGVSANGEIYLAEMGPDTLTRLSPID